MVCMLIELRLGKVEFKRFWLVMRCCLFVGRKGCCVVKMNELGLLFRRLVLKEGIFLFLKDILGGVFLVGREVKGFLF